MTGNIAIPQGQSTVTVTGLGLSSAATPSLTVIAPVNAPDLIFPAGLIGPATTDGFTVQLNAPPSVAGYSAQWDIDLGGSSPAPTPAVPSYNNIRTIPFSHVLADAVELWSGEASANSYDATIFNRHIRKRATQFWEMFYWPEWTVLEQRQFRATWASTTVFDAGDFTYWPWTTAYYQALVDNTNQPPVILVSGSWALNTASWALAQGDYSWLPIFDPSGGYDAGTQIIWPYTQLPYQALQAVPAGIAPSNTAYWAPLVEFVRNIAYAQAWETNTITEVKKVYDLNPWVHPNACDVPFIVSNRGIVCRVSPPIVWVEFRLPAPRWAGPIYNAALSYPSGQTVYFNSGTSSDFWVTTGATAPGQTPLTDPELFALIPFPYVFRECAAQAAYSDMLRVDGQMDKAPGELSEAMRLLRLEFDKIERQQGQTRPLKVVNRHNANQAWG